MNARILASLLLGLAAILYSHNSLSQIEGIQEFNVIPPSPNAASFQKYVDIPMNYYTGRPSIGIPLYDIQMKQLSLPISLSYDAGGLKVEENASWVGAGWSLNAGGAISRTVKGLPDELNQGIRKGYLHYHLGYLANGSVDFGTVNDCSAEAPLTTSDPVNSVDSIAIGLRDLDPDIYYLSYPAGSSKFVFSRPDSTLTGAGVVELSKTDLSYIDHPFDSAAGFPTIAPSDSSYVWIIEDDKGVTYKFTKAEKTEVQSDCGTAVSAYDGWMDYYQSTWYLTEMSLGNEWIRFDYESETLTYDINMSESSKFKVAGSAGGTQIVNTFCEFNTTVTALRLSEITTSNNYRVVFEADTAARADLTGAHRLKSMRVWKTDGTSDLHLVRGFDFDNDQYFGSSAKLKLDSVLPVDQSGDSISGHSFDYFDPSNVPAVTSTSQDLWGYYNGATNGTSMIPEYRSPLYHVNRSSAVNRNSVLTHTRKGTLKKITYPTGGYTEFEYELHQQWNTNLMTTYSYSARAESPGTTADTIAFTVATAAAATIIEDGLQNDDFGFTEIWVKDPQTDIYNPTSLTSTGFGRFDLPAGDYKLYAEHTSSTFSEITLEFEQYGAGAETIGGLRLKHMKFTDPAQATSVTKVFEYADTTGLSSGKLFSVPLLGGHTTMNLEGSIGGSGGTVCFEGSTRTDVHVSKASMIPLGLYNGSHIGYSMVKEYNIDEANLTQTITNAMKEMGMTEHTFINDANTPSFFPYVQTSFNGYKNGKKLKETNYRLNGSTLEAIRETDYIYSSSIVEDKVEGLNLKYKATKFCYDCGNVPGVELYASNTYRIKSMHHALSEVVTKEYEATGTLQTSSKYSYNTSNSYLLFAEQRTEWSDGNFQRDTLLRTPGKPALVTEVKKYVSPVSSFSQQTQIGGQKTSYNGTLPEEFQIWDSNSGNYYLARDFDYDSNLNLTSVADFDSTAGFRTSHIWGYDNESVIAQVTNADEDEIFHTSFEDATTNTSTDSKTGNLSHYNVSYTVVLPSAGTYILTYWEKDGSGDWTYKEQTVSANTAIGGTGLKIDEVRLCPADAQMTTYTYKPGFGVTSVTDPNNITVYYEYDDFGRLKLVKDHEGNILSLNQYKYHNEN